MAAAPVPVAVTSAPTKLIDVILVAVPTATPSSLMVIPLILPLPPPVALIVTSPVLELTETLVPATILVTGVLRVEPSPRAV